MKIIIRHSISSRTDESFFMFLQCRDKVLFFGEDGSAIAVMGLPMMKYPGVKARGSLMSVDGAVRGRFEDILRRMASIWARRVVKALVDNLVDPTVLWRRRFIDLTAVSRSSPKWGVLGGIVNQSMWFWLAKLLMRSLNSSSWRSRLNSSSPRAPMNVVELSL